MNHLHPRMLCAKFGWKWPSGSIEEDFQKFSMYFLLFFQLSPLWAECGPSFIQTWIPFTQECFVLSLVEAEPVVLEMNFFSSFQCIFTILPLSPLLSRAWPFMNPLHKGILSAKFGWNWSWRWKFLKVVNLFLFPQLSPLWEGRGPSF